VEARRSGYDEAMMLDVDGFVAECSGENVFIARNGRVKTTPHTSILAGITRDSVLTILQASGVDVVEERFTRDEGYLADEAFMTGTAAEVTPVREIDDRQIGSGHPGPITCDLQQRFTAITRGEDAAYQRWLTPIA
jgi:branched-chain amino acid aminotransferase